MVVKREGPRLPLVSTGLVLPRLTSLVLCGILILVDLSWRVEEVQGPRLAWVVWYNVLVMNHSPLGVPGFVRECSILGITDSGGTEVNHLIDWVSVLNERHARKLRQCSSQAVSSYPQFGSLVEAKKSVHLCNKLPSDWLGWFLESGMNIAAAFRPHLVLGLNAVEVCDKLLWRSRSHKNNINWVVAWQVAYIALNIERMII